MQGDLPTRSFLQNFHWANASFNTRLYNIKIKSQYRAAGTNALEAPKKQKTTCCRARRRHLCGQRIYEMLILCNCQMFIRRSRRRRVFDRKPRGRLGAYSIGDYEG